MSRGTRRSTICLVATGLITTMMLSAGCDNGPEININAKPAITSKSGVVIDGPIQGARVCLDVNANNTCDDGEPTSEPTASDGSWQISGIGSAQARLTPPLLAEIPVTAVDQDNPDAAITQAYKMTAASDGNGVISPISTLVLAGIASGLTPSEARTSVAAQAGVPVNRLFDNYTLSRNNADSQRLATFASQAVVPALQAGQPLEVGRPTQSNQDTYTVSAMRYNDADNYFVRAIAIDGQIVNGLGSYRPLYLGRENGQAQAAGSFYSGEIFLDSLNGWSTCDADQKGGFSLGNPRRVTICGSEFVQSLGRKDLNRTSMSEAIESLQQSNGRGTWNIPTTNLSGARFPAGSQLLSRNSKRVHDALRYQPADGPLGSFTRLTDLVAAYPTPSQRVVGQNTLELGGVFDEASGARVARITAAFGPAAGQVSYYRCNESLITCTDFGTGRYLTYTASGATIIEMTDIPGPLSRMPRFIQREGAVWAGYQLANADLGDSLQLNEVGVRALAQVIGFQLPEPLR